MIGNSDQGSSMKHSCTLGGSLCCGTKVCKLCHEEHRYPKCESWICNTMWKCMLKLISKYKKEIVNP